MVDYFLSGAVAASEAGTPLALGGPKQRCVLAVLLAHRGSVVSVDRIVDAVWAESAPAKTLTSVRSYVANLRRVLDATAGGAGPARLVSRPHGYQLDLLEGDTVDLFCFEDLVVTGRAALVRGDARAAEDDLVAALALWQGDPFGEFAAQEFAATEAIRFEALRAAAVEARFDAGLQLGVGADLVPELEAAVAEHPLQERLWGHLVLALHQAHRTADALRAFDRATAVLEEEVGASPGEGLRAVLRQVREEAPASPVARPVAVVPPLFVGRDAELDLVTGVGVAGGGGLMLVTGESGIGKTALVQVATDRARAAGAVVAWAGHPSGVRLPLLWTWIQVLRQAGSAAGEAGRRAVLAEAPDLVAALVPEWDDTGAVDERAPASGFALVEGIVTALRILAAHASLVVVVDDLQHADEESLDVLALVAAEFPRLPVQVVGTWTWFGSERPMNRAAFDRLARSCDRGVVHLGGLDEAAAVSLVEATAGAPVASGVAAEVWRRAGGNPFYVKEMARSLAGADAGATVPSTVVGVVGRRLDALDPACRRVLEAAAVIGPEFAVADLADVVDLPISAVRARLQPAWQAGLVDELSHRPGALRFSHGLLRDALLAQLSGAERSRVHAAIAARRAPGMASSPYELAISTADHAWQAGSELDPVVALTLVEGAVRRAMDRSAYADIVDLTRKAIQVCERLPAEPAYLDRQVTLWLHLAGAQSIVGGMAGADATESVRRAFEIGQDLKGRSFYSAVAMQCQVLVAHGRIDEAMVIGAGLHEEHLRTGDPDIGLVSNIVQVMSASLRGDVDELVSAGQHMLDTFAPPETLTDPLHFFHPRVLCWMALGEACRGRAEECDAHIRHAFELAHARNSLFDVLVARIAVVESAAILGRLDGTAELADGVDRDFVAAGSEQWAAVARIIAVWARTLSGEPGEDDPRLVVRQALEDYTFDGTRVMTPFLLALIADIEAAHGDLDAARELVQRAARVARATGEQAWSGAIAERAAALAAPTATA